MRRSGTTSIASQVRRSVVSISVLLAVPAVIGLVIMLMYSARTQAMIRRMDEAAGMKPALENTIAENLFSVAAGRTSFESSGAVELIEQTDQTLDKLLIDTGAALMLRRNKLHTGTAVANTFKRTAKQYGL